MNDGVYWIGQNGKVYTKRAGEGVLAHDRQSFQTASSMGVGGYDQLRQIQDPADTRPPVQQSPTTTQTTPTSYNQPAYDPAYEAFLQQQAREAEDTAEAQRIRDSILGRRQAVQDMLTEILGNIDSQLKEGKGNREASFNRDVADLVSSLDGSIPDIENAFSALGLSNSTYKADRVQDTRDAYERSYVDTDRQREEDLTSMQQKATGEKAKWRGEANNILDTIGTFEAMKPTHNDLNRLRGADLDSQKSLNSFRSSRDAYQPGSDALSAITKLDGDYDFSRTLDSFNSLASASNPASGAVGAQGAGAGRLFADDKKNKKKTEVQVNNPVGAASA